MSSPVFTKNEVFNSPSAAAQVAATPGEGVMTYHNTLMKTLGMFAILLVTAVVGWQLAAILPPGMMFVAVIGLAIATLVLGIAAAMKKEPSVPLYLVYTVLEGLLIGAISAVFERIWPGVVVQATLGTLVVAGVVFALFTSGKVRETPKLRKFFLVAVTGYILFSLTNFVLIIFNVVPSPFGVRGIEFFGIPLGIIIGLFAVVLASISLISDYTYIQKGVESGLPEKYGWTASFGLMVTIVWLYIEILRILGLSRN